MRPGGPAAWPALALLLLWLPGCAALSCPRKVRGTVGGSLSLQCRYEEEFKDRPKLWCKRSILCMVLVKTTDSEREVRSGRVSISDHPANLSLTVTMENLTLEDAGSYECQVDTWWLKGFDPRFSVEVTVLPALPAASSPESPTSTHGPPTSLSTHTWPVTTREDTPSPHQQPGSPVINIYLLLLILEVPLLLGMLSAVLWVNRPQRSSGARRGPDYENQ